MIAPWPLTRSIVIVIGPDHSAAVAEQYDRFRPGCPDELIDELAAPQPATVLDIGCGTGKAAVALAARGLTVLGVELDERMAAVARGHGVPVEVGDFETWADAGRQFDLITCSDAWHWIDPEQGLAKVARLLRPGGVFARFWNYHVLSADLIAAFDAAYRAARAGSARAGRRTGRGRRVRPARGERAVHRGRDT